MTTLKLVPVTEMQQKMACELEQSFGFSPGTITLVRHIDGRLEILFAKDVIVTPTMVDAIAASLNMRIT